MSNIHFNTVKLNNFMSYEQEEFIFDNTGYVLISGINNNTDDNSASNGSGKSSLFSAVCWCITGETPSGNKKVENIYLSGETSVELNFDVNDHNYTIKRCKNPSNLFIYIDNENKSGKGIRDGEKLLKEYLPDLSSSLINSVIILGQGLPQRFSNNSPSGRKEILEQLSNSDFMISDIKQRISNRKLILDQELQSVNYNIVENESDIELLTSVIEENKAKISNLNIANLELSLDELNAEKEDIKVDLDSYESAKSESELLLNQVTINTQQLYDTYDNELSNLNLISEEEIEKDILHISDLKTNIKYKQDEITKLDSVVDICPTCGQKLPDVVKLDTTELKKECDTLLEELANKSKELNDKKSLNSKLITELDNKYNEKKKELQDTLSTIRYDINNYTNIINDKEFKLKEISDKIVEIETTINGINSNIKLLQDMIDEDLKKIDTLKLELSKLYERRNIVNQKLDIVIKINTLIKRDFRGYLLTNIIDFISSRVKLYSSKVFGTTNLEFKLDGNNILISYDNKEYESLSGGEKQKVDIIIQLAIRDMLCNYLNFSSNILVLDEITDSLDIIGSQNILNLISSELHDVECIYIISHHTDFDIPWDDEITIIKDSNKISRIMR